MTLNDSTSGGVGAAPTRLTRIDQARPTNLRVLMVGDREDDFTVVSSVLKRAGATEFALEWANGYEAGLAELLPGEHDVYLVDEQLGLHSGLELVEAAKEQGVQRPIVVMAHDLDQELGLQAIRAGAADYLLKGTSGDALARAIWYTLERHRAFEELRQMGLYDGLTGVANRPLFYDRLREACFRAQRRNSFTGLLYIDVDDFKSINDTWGHVIGDQLISEVANRLTNIARDVDTVARMGGDEFAVILDDMAQPQNAALVAKRITDSFAKPFNLPELNFQATASIGVAVYPCDAKGLDELLTCADTAMYRAKSGGGNQQCSFDRSLDTERLKREAWLARLHAAVADEEFVLHYQPLIDLHTGQASSFECLLRWVPKDGGPTVPPNAFIPDLESTGLISTVGEWVLRSACEQLRDWQRDRLPVDHLSINLSPIQLRAHDLRFRFQETFSESGLSPGSIELELTENALVEAESRDAERFSGLADAGFRLALDDFGTGYCGLNAIRSLPAQRVKLDRSLVSNTPSNSASATIVSSVIPMLRGLGHEVVAEGVETAQELNFLRSHGCDVVQGYLFARPMPAAEVPRWVNAHKSVLDQFDQAA